MKKIRAYLPLPLVLTFFLLNFLSCKKDGEPWWDADFSGPIAKTTLNINNLVADSILVSDPTDSALRISFTANVFNYKVDSLVSIPDTTLDTIYPLLGGISYSPSQSIYTLNDNFNFNFSNVNLVYAKIKTGVIKLEANSSLAQPSVLQYTLTKSNFGGSNFTITEEIPGGTIANPGTLTKYYTVDGMELDLTGSSGNSYNRMEYTTNFSISPNASAGVTANGESFGYSISFIDVIPLYAKGYLGNQVVDAGPDTADFQFLKGLNADYFAFQDATVDLKITNGFGADISASNISISSLNSNNGNLVTLSGSGVSSTYNLNRAVYNGVYPNPVTNYVKNIPLNSGNSNIKAFVENLPDKVSYNLQGQLNPLGNVSANNDFVHYGYGFSADMDIDIPLAFATTNLRLQDTIDFDISTLAQTENINHGQLVLRADNGYPFNAQIQAFFLDQNNAVIDSLFASPNTAIAGNVDASLKVTSKNLSLLYAPLDHAKLEKIKSAKKIVFKVVMNTVSQVQIVKIYSYYSMGLVLTADINYSVNKK